MQHEKYWFQSYIQSLYGSHQVSHFDITVWDFEYQEQSMQSILVDELNRLAVT